MPYTIEALFIDRDGTIGNNNYISYFSENWLWGRSVRKI